MRFIYRVGENKVCGFGLGGETTGVRKMLGLCVAGCAGKAATTTGNPRAPCREKCDVELKEMLRCQDNFRFIRKGQGCMLLRNSVEGHLRGGHGRFGLDDYQYRLKLHFRR